MDTLQQVLDLFLHLQDHLHALTRDHGAWVYFVLFTIIFAETGLVVTPFLPGDSLLFAVGAIAANIIVKRRRNKNNHIIDIVVVCGAI